jgi:hypothetical protein
MSKTNLAMTAVTDEGASAGTIDLLQFIEEDLLGPRAWFEDARTDDMALCGLMDQIRYGTTTTTSASECRIPSPDHGRR